MELVWILLVLIAVQNLSAAEDCDDYPIIRICELNTCGSYAQCTIKDNQQVCSCIPGYEGDPLVSCKKLGCTDNSECRDDQACADGKCINPCGSNTCGNFAYCHVEKHLAKCSCPKYFVKDSNNGCNPMGREQICSFCSGNNTKCDVYNYTPLCTCLPGFVHDPLRGCWPRCESNSDCRSEYFCNQFQCVYSCSICGRNAVCEGVVNHTATCKCIEGHYGDPYKYCHAQCQVDADCHTYKPVCQRNDCINPCKDACGINAICTVSGDSTICTCPENMSGNPKERCDPIEIDPCDPNPCGHNAVCTPVNTSKCPMCTCPVGFIGDPLRCCTKGECFSDAECPDTKSCVGHLCIDPCQGKCGIGAECNVRRHTAVCTCPHGDHGNALVSCNNNVNRKTVKTKGSGINANTITDFDVISVGITN